MFSLFISIEWVLVIKVKEVPLNDRHCGGLNEIGPIRSFFLNT